MFKKAFKVSSNNNLSGKDKKKLIADLCKFCDPDSVNTLLDKNCPTLVLTKVQGTRIQIYLAGDIPLIIDASGKGDYFPTIYAMELCPNLTKALEINQGVDSYLLNGANLMWPGVRNIKTLENFKKDEIRCVKTSDNRIIAVGTLACNSQELATKGPSGNALQILHVIEDKLWELGPKKSLTPLTVEAKKEKEELGQITEDKEGETSEVKEAEEVKIDEIQENKEDKEGEEGESGEEEGNEEETDRKKKKGKKGKGKNAEDSRKDKKGKKQKGGEAEESGDDQNEEDKFEETKEGEEKVSVEEMDGRLMEAFLTSLKISLDEKDLPMDAGEFYSNHLIPCKREGVFIDLKNTSYKKIGKFLQAMSKLGIIDFKEPKKGAVPQITKIHKQIPKLRDFVPVVDKAAKKEVKIEEVSEDDRWPKIEIKEIFRLKPQLFHVLQDDYNKEKFYTREEVQTLVQKYINSKGLADKRLVKLDENLRPLFWVEKATIEGGQGNTTPHYTMNRDDLLKKLEDYLHPYYKIKNIQTQEEDTKQGAFKGITLLAEKDHNKNVTRINGLEPFLFNISSLEKKFQLKFACSVSTEKYLEKGVEKTEVTVHGNFIDAISDYLVNECKIEKKYISATNKLGKKKKQ